MLRMFRRPLGGIAIAVACAAGCSDSTGIDADVEKATDSFDFQLTRTTPYTGTLEYSYRSTGQAVTVTQTSSVSAGLARLTVIDSYKNEIYYRDLAQNGTFTSNGAVPGTWKIRISMNNAVGTFHVRVVKQL